MFSKFSAQPDNKNGDEKSVARIFQAVRSGNLELLQSELKQNPNFPKDAREYGITLLHTAIMHTSNNPGYYAMKEIIEFLVKLKFATDARSKDSNMHSILHSIIRRSLHIDIVKLFLENGAANSLLVKDRAQKTPYDLMVAKIGNINDSQKDEKGNLSDEWQEIFSLMDRLLDEKMQNDPLICLRK